MKVVNFLASEHQKLNQGTQICKMCTYEGDVIQYDILDPVYVGSDASGNLGKVTIPQCSHNLNKWLDGGSHQDIFLLAIQNEYAFLLAIEKYLSKFGWVYVPIGY